MGRLIFNSSNKGSLLVSMAVIMPIFILLIGFIVDIGRALVVKDNLNQACMVAAEEAAKSIDINKASEDGLVILSDNYEEIAIKYFKDNLKENNFLDIIYIRCEVSDSIDNPRLCYCL
ncbi:MAG: TadE/TadG family type IV pilus assembly protein [Actinomycetota bacterium]|nr:TadE/TadG family type IV pilus assembly protein [Actinomycetota bacterium]